MLLRLWIVALLLCSSAAPAEPYVAARAGAHWWPDTSNRDEIEAGSRPGADVAIAAGYTPMRYSDLYAIDVEAEISARFDALHGRNHDHATDERSADGHWLAQGALTLGAWPRARVAGPLWIQGGAAGGAAVVRAFDDVDLVPTWSAGAGVVLELDLVDLELGWRHVQTSARLDSYELDYEAEVGFVGVRW